MKFRSRFSRDTSGCYGSPAGDVSMTDPQYLRDCDINCILKDYKITGKLPEVAKPGVFADVSRLGDFAEHMRVVNDGREHFAALPAEIRARFGNDPAAYFDFVVNPENQSECVRLGIMDIIKQEPSAIDVLKQIRDKFVTAPAANPSSADSVGAPNT